MLERKNNSEVDRVFIPCEAWLYYKIYLGEITSDKILREGVGPLIEQLFGEGAIDKWFFIRFKDPANHIRVRFHLRTERVLGSAVNMVTCHLRPFVTAGLIGKVQIDTYEREVERYSPLPMDLVEDFFWFDSTMALELMVLLGLHPDEELRWKAAVRAADEFLGEFGFDLEQKIGFCSQMRNSFAMEFREDRHLRDALDEKFRRRKQEVESVLKNGTEQELADFLLPIARRNQKIAEVMRRGDLASLGFPVSASASPLLSSFLHMTMNRLFRTDQRLHEFIVYDFLTRYYRSTFARKGTTDSRSGN